MNPPDFIDHIYEPDVHDGIVVQVRHRDATASILVKAYEGQLFAFDFDGVKSVMSFEPEGMMLYSLTEMAAMAPFRRFVFTNWDEEGKSVLEVVAQHIGSREIANEEAF